MKRVILLALVALLGLSSYASSYETAKDSSKTKKTEYRINQFKHNWEVSLVLGTNGFMGESVKHYKSPIDIFTLPSVDINVQKWLTPAWGMGLGINYAPVKSLYHGSNYNVFSNPETDEQYSKDTYYQVSKGNMMGVYLKGSSDLANLFAGYKRHRVFHPIVYLGGGFLFPLDKMEYRPCAVTFCAGILFNFQITEHFLLGLNLEGDLISDNFEGRYSSFQTPDMTNIPFDANQKIGINLTYRFAFVKTENAETGEEERLAWIPATKSSGSDKMEKELAEAKNSLEKELAAVKDSLEKELALAKDSIGKVQKNLALAKDTANQLRNDLALANGTANQLRNDLALAKDVQAEQTRAKGASDATKEQSASVMSSRDSIYYWQLITFPIDKWTITNRERVNIMAAAEAIKSTPGVKYVITGFADSQTGTSSRNVFLSKKRTETILKVLVEEYGVPAEQLSTDYKGGVDNLYFNDERCSRAVFIAPAKTQNK